MAKILLIDDELTMVQMIAEILRVEGHEVFPFTNGDDALQKIESIGPELVVSDLYLEKHRALGLEILQKARALNPPPVVIIITAFGSIESAVEAMKKGAYDFLEKPFKLEELKICINRALSYNQAVSENIYLRKQLRQKYKFNQIIGSSRKMQDVFRMIERVADTDSTILIRGESGTGKELVAKAIHFNSRRQFAPFVPINCGALPEHILESELFGHKKGAFTGAINDKKGLFEEADGGTIFLDEISSMPLALQSRMLRVLQDHEIRRVGDNISTFVNVRVLVATNENLEDKIQKGEFREDLFYRLNVISINLPPLRERSDDIPLLTAHFLQQRINPRTGDHFAITKQAMATLEIHDWPGNIRELENALERACTLCEGDVIELSDLPSTLHKYKAQVTPSTEIDGKIHAPTPAARSAQADIGRQTTNSLSNSTQAPNHIPNSLKSFMRYQETLYIKKVLAQTNGDKERAADILGISLATLYRKMSEQDD